MKRLLILLGVIAVMIVLGIWWFSPERVVKRRAKHLMEVLSMSEGAGGPLRQAKVFSMNGLMENRIKISAPDIDDANGSFDKQEVESAFSWICRNAKSSDFRIVDYDVVEVEGDEARTIISVDGYMELPGYRPADGSFKVTIDWQKAEDGWRFYSVVWENS
ncbi:hypothetical protein [Luteolibacter sp. AS25]|uniref:hypothetical protein n=1 Tax=Luteolibacter sp. AS25 TaxID=3135776 RepID=UPI00398B2518